MIKPTILAVLFNGELTNEAVLNGGVLSSEISYRFYEKSARIISSNKDLKGIRKEYNYILDIMGIADVFQILKTFSESVLKCNDSQIQYDRTKLTEWTRVFQKIGQDVPICAFLAGEVIEGKAEAEAISRCFDWPAVIISDDESLKSILKNGLAENHFHLEASTQVFPLTWACMMNYPWEACEKLRQKIVDHSFFHKINDWDTQMIKYNTWINSVNQDWGHVPTDFSSDALAEEMCQIVKDAAILRALLFLKIIEPHSDIMPRLEKYRRHPYDLNNWSLIKALRRNIEPEHRISECDWRFDKDGGTSVGYEIYRLRNLDYAITNQLFMVDPRSPNRLLAGERNFLYQCFLNIFSDKWGKNEKDLLYTYIIEKVKIRDRYVQTNSRMGFDNFQEIQRRKSEMVYAKKNVYAKENYRLSLGSTLKDYGVTSLEVRIMAEESFDKLTERIRTIDSQVEKSKILTYKDVYQKFVSGDHCSDEKNGYFFTVHIGRKADSPAKIDGSLVPRNNKKRKSAGKAVDCLDSYFHGIHVTSGAVDIKKRIFGMDVCSSEEGCRPDVFATEFRYVRKECKGCGLTYHVGEAFDSLLDGLRAVDEAVRFLELTSGDRLGHALALGMDPKKVYTIMKRMQDEIYLPQQDVLDDLVWLLYRSAELGVELNDTLKILIKKKAVELFKEIYVNDRTVFWNKHGESWLEEYFISWKLRGDHPSMYKNKVYNPVMSLTKKAEYNACMKSDVKYISDDMRMNEDAAYLYYLYHYSRSVKERGAKEYLIDMSDITGNLLKGIAGMQKAMRKEVSGLGICIECNPTSNFRIGGMESFEDHPIATFCGVKKKDEDINVSINTDNVGVFDISLPHEYMIIKDALLRSGDYTESEIGDYLHRVKKMGISMSFH